jgi:hypothetical protein
MATSKNQKQRTFVWISTISGLVSAFVRALSSIINKNYPELSQSAKYLNTDFSNTSKEFLSNEENLGALVGIANVFLGTHNERTKSVHQFIELKKSLSFPLTSVLRSVSVISTNNNNNKSKTSFEHEEQPKTNFRIKPNTIRVRPKKREKSKEQLTLLL